MVGERVGGTEHTTAFSKELPETRVFYAVKANPVREGLRLMAKHGSCFDTASVDEIQRVLAAGATPDRISYGNTIKKRRDVEYAASCGVRRFTVDVDTALQKVIDAAPGATICVRLRHECGGAEWPMSRKFG